MATKTARKPSPARGGGKSRAAETRPRQRREDPPAGPAPWRVTLHSMVEDQSDDLWGLAFLLLAVLTGLGLYAGGDRPGRPRLADGVGRCVRVGPLRATSGLCRPRRVPYLASRAVLNRPGSPSALLWPSWPRPACSLSSPAKTP